MSRKLIWAVPLLCFIALAVLLLRGLQLEPQKIPSPLVGKAMPALHLPNLISTDSALTEKDVLGRVTLLNVWATWCATCAEEHTTLMSIKKHGIPVLGFDYKDDNGKAEALLQDTGNPYEKVGTDAQGRAAIDWGVYGTPETFVLDKHGMIRYKHIGALTESVLNDSIYPLVKRLQGEQ